jgi:hypothetical protein
MRRPCTLVFIFATLFAHGTAAQAAVLSFVQGMGQGDGDVYEIFEGGSCVMSGFEVYLSGLAEPLSALEFSIAVPFYVGLEPYGLPEGELSCDGHNFRFDFEECLQPSERIQLVHILPQYTPVVVDQACLGPAVPSQLGLAQAGYRTCDGELRELELRSWPERSLPDGCVVLHLDVGGLAPEVSWGMIKSCF